MVTWQLWIWKVKLTTGRRVDNRFNILFLVLMTAFTFLQKMALLILHKRAHLVFFHYLHDNTCPYFILAILRKKDTVFQRVRINVLKSIHLEDSSLIPCQLTEDFSKWECPMSTPVSWPTLSCNALMSFSAGAAFLGRCLKVSSVCQGCKWWPRQRLGPDRCQESRVWRTALSPGTDAAQWGHPVAQAESGQSSRDLRLD